MYSKVMIFILALICILMLRSVVELYGKYKKVEILKAEPEKERLVLEEKVNKSEDKNQALHTPRGAEEYIRRTYPVTKDGEGVIVIYDASSSPVVPVRKDSTWQEKFKAFFTGLFTSKN